MWYPNIKGGIFSYQLKIFIWQMLKFQNYLENVPVSQYDHFISSFASEESTDSVGYLESMGWVVTGG